MKNKFKISIIGGLALVLGSGYFYISNADKETNVFTGIYLDGNSQLHSEELKNSKKTDSKYVGYIEGDFVNNADKEISENFSLNKIYFKEVSLEIPNYFQTFTSVEADNVLSLTNKKENSNNPYRKNNVSIDIVNNYDNRTVEDYVNNLKSIDEHSTVNSTSNTRILKEITTDGNIVKAKYNVDFKNLIGDENYKQWESNSSQTKFKVYNYVVFKNDKIYNIEYSYEDEAIGNKVIDILNKSITIKIK